MNLVRMNLGREIWYVFGFFQENLFLQNLAVLMTLSVLFELL